MTTLVFIDGDQGTTGLQIRARLAGRTDIQLLSLPESERKQPERRAQALNDCDIALLCLPDEAAREAAGWVRNPAVRIIDASSAHRTDAAWTYGLPELCPGQAARIAGSRRISNPGCYPTGALALLRPLVDAGLLPASLPLNIHAVSGYSGRGRAGVDAHEQRAADAPAPPPFQVYGLGLAHKHVPEIQQHAGLRARPFFVPAYGAFRQGIVLTVPLHLRQLAPGTTVAALHAALQARYAATPRVQLLSLAEAAALDHLDPTALNSTDDLRLAVLANEAQGQVLLAAVFDNLGKGAAGAAVQNLDLLLRGA
ncbi:N-acetyl-gamma-glutamyl-phosphate reductase [Ideonella sp. DXS22W]|uniref:N-acetyl-gamma-glutamyl-phosphate reductase n=1 Tax=Pseudaquabacterium inlustre TaxID=2984192 RepID=A0ABU9CG07_9BURK